jgi:hypothetical protein
MSFLLRSWLRRHFQATLGVVAIGVVCGVVGALPRILARDKNLWRDCAEAYARFPDLKVPWEAALAQALPPWVLEMNMVFWLLGYGGLGLLTALLVRPRSRDEDVVAGVASGLVAGLAAFALGGLSWSVTLSVFNEDLIRPESDLLMAGYRETPGDPLGTAHPELRGLSTEEQARALRMRLGALAVEKVRPTLTAVLIYALSLGGACGVVGVMTAGWLLRSRRPFWRVLLLYTCVVIPTLPLISSLLVAPAGVSEFMINVERALLTATILLGLIRRWPARLLAPLYVAGFAACVRIGYNPLPAVVIVAAAVAAAGAVAWHVLGTRQYAPASE